MNIARTIHGLLWTAIFILFAGWQFNDPDPAIWVTIYGASAVLGIMYAFTGKYKAIHVLAIVAAIAGAIIWWPGRYEGLSLDQGYTPGIEEARESLGLAIVALSNILFYILPFRKKSRK